MAKTRTAVPDHRPVVSFLTRCAGLLAIVLWLVTRVPAVESAGVRLTLASVLGVLSLAGQKVEASGDTIHAFGTALRIVPDCSPHLPFLIFCAVVLAFPTSMGRRLLGVLLGAVVIQLFNMARVVALLWVLAVRRPWFEFVHVYLWQTGTILVVFLSLALWIGTMSWRREVAPG